MKTSIELPDMILDRIRDYNKTHANRPINVSGVCRIALESELVSVGESVDKPA